jgi:predicted dithiol-disulfide oxidoreductase (DUF899 family)
MGWTVPRVSSSGNTFNKDLGLSTDKGENHGLSIFIRDGDSIYHTYFTTARGTEQFGTVWSLLDMTPLGGRKTVRKAGRKARSSPGCQ